jgi:hypothetical protein
MKHRNVIKLGVLVLVATLLASTWALVSAADGQLATVTANSTATYTHLGVATVGGSLDCGSFVTLHISGSLQQPIGRRDSVSGSFATDVSCGPGSPTGWSAVVVPGAGKFGGGSAILTGNYYGYARVDVGYNWNYPPYPNCSGPYWDYNYGGYYYQCSVNGSFGPQAVKMTQ